MSEAKVEELKINGVPFIIDLSQNEPLWRFCTDKMYERETFQILDNYLDKDRIMLDLGAWEGPLSLYAATKSKQVHAVDPDPICIKMFKKQLQLNPSFLNKIEIHQLALSTENGNSHLYQRNGLGDSASSLLERARDSGEAVEVAVKTLDSFLKTNNINSLGFIKFDIEGAEFELLKKNRTVLKEVGCPTLLVAFHITYLKESFLNELIKNKLLIKVLLKFKKYLFNKRIRSTMKVIFENLTIYNYVLSSNNEIIDTKSLVITDDIQLIFTNNKR